MVTVKALMDGREAGLTPLGEMRSIKGAPAGEMVLEKWVEIPGAGAYWKTFRAPIYSRQVMEELSRKGQLSWSFTPQNCIGMITRQGSGPKGYVQRQMGLHDLCVPVFPVAGLSFLAWRVAGYLPAGDGYLAVMKRRVAYWVWLGIAAAVAFVTSYLLFRYGPEMLWSTIVDLPQTLSDAWFRMLREWGIL